MIPLLGNVVEIKKIVPTNQDSKIIQEDGIQGLGHSSPTDVAESLLINSFLFFIGPNFILFD